MKQLYCCPRLARGIISFTKYALTLALLVMFVNNGTAANSYYEDESSFVSNDAGSSIDNLLNLSAKLDASNAFYSFPNGDEAKGGDEGDCPCPNDEAPELSIESQTIALQCPEDVPAAPEVTAFDDCDGDVDVQFFQFSGENGDVVCSASDAIGENPAYWAIWLPTLPDGYTDQWRFVEDGSFNEYPDDTAILTGTVASINNPNRRFKIHIKLVGNYDWPTWNSMMTIGNPVTNRIYKDAQGFAAENNNFETFSYYEIDETASYLVGEGDLTGAYLNLQHAPSNFLFGAQVGLGANDTNGNFGMSSWFTYTGFFPDADGNLVETSGQGDVNIDLDCGSPVYQCAFEVDYTYIAIDQCGNAATATLTYDVEDTEGPVLTGCPEDMTVECDAIPDPATVTALDNCVGEVEVTYSSESQESKECPQAMTITRVWAAEDSCGNRTECQQILTVIDTTSPVLEDAPADLTLECGAEIPPMADLTATDNCDAEVEVLPASSITTDVECPVVEVISRSWTAYDDCGNTSTVSQTITIVDTEAPEIIQEAEDMTVECDGDGNTAELEAWLNNYGGALASDLCGEVTWSTSCESDNGEEPGGENPTGQVIVNCTFNDSGSPVEIFFNAAFDTDDNGYAIYAFGSINGATNDEAELLFNAALNRWEVRTFGGARFASDIDSPNPSCDINDWYNVDTNCNISGISCIEADDTQDLPGVDPTLACEVTQACTEGESLTVIFTAIDECGNSAVTSATFSLIDTTDPVLEGGSTGTDIVECDEDEPEVSAPTAYDSCAGELEVQESVEYNDDNSCAGSIIYTWTATDECGNSAVQTYTLLVVDSEAPVFIDCPEDEQYACADEVPEPAMPSAEDNCDEDVDVFFFQTDLSDPNNSTCEVSNSTGDFSASEDWSIWVPGLPNGISSNFLWDENGATAYVSGDQILITGTVENVDDPSYKFGVYLQGENKVDWAGWNGQNTTSPPILPRSYKDDYGHAAAGGNLWETWNYYEIDGDHSYLFGRHVKSSQISYKMH